ncbi:sushi, von Willebrand factor type A, EGF and pentraxin domain-containing protein 1-like [Mytilus trossulus]|uniref:sushi, von Willebrand factor type A, EGF and pentraxin domain-containing protein 1-like n=1 Tax=Mytilus trossulus TaxID=6551 RepID=UPI003004816C
MAISIVQCEDILPDSLTNGTVTVTERNIGSTTTFSCDAGHSLVGKASITCTSSGWDGYIPQCTKIICPETVAFFRGSKYIFKCNMATWPESEAYCNTNGGQLTSIETGDENSFLLDVMALMKTKELIANVFFWIGLTDNNDEMSYKWLSGEPLNYSNWYQGGQQQPDNLNILNQTDAHFQCEDIPTNNITNGAVTVTERTIGSTAKFTCDAGHSLVGNETITCTSSGWNGNIPQCRFQCEDIPTNNIRNGAVTVTERTIGSTAKFTCDAGHSLVGNENITCTSTGWNGNIPQCRYIIVVQCEDILTNNLTNGAVTVTERTIGSTANFTCDAGYSLVGYTTITCTSLGWNGNIPQCRFQCEDIPTNNITNGTVTVTERTIGSTAKFTCDAGYSLVGNKTITCSSSGWNGNIPQCRLYIVCPETIAFFRGSKYIFSCAQTTWYNSEANCIASGGHLTSIETAEENTFLLDVIVLMENMLGKYAYVWIGLTDNNDEMSYQWLSGESLNFSNWYQGPPQQPDNKDYDNQPGAHCAMINRDLSLKWNDEFCSNIPLRSVCEIR